MKKFAVFDIDGTIFRWQLYHELFDELYRLKIISEEEAGPVFRARDAWRERKLSFSDYEIRLVMSMERSIVGLEESVLIEAAESIIKARGSHIYHYTTQLLRQLKDQGYLIMAISGSQQQIIEKFASLHGIDISYGKKHEIVDGKIVGSKHQVYGRKAEILTELVGKHGLSWEESYAVGDTNTDSDMLELVENPIAFNPDKNLYERARKEGWKIVVERKNIVYELSSNGNTFVLA